MICPDDVRLKKELAATGKEFFRDKDSERRADGTADDADGPPAKFENIKPGVVARPTFEWPRPPILP